MNEFTREKKCAVLGLARAGAPAARFLVERGNRVLGYDSKPREELSDEALALENLGVELHLGDHNYASLNKCHLIVLSPGLKIHHEPLQSLLLDAQMRGVEVIGELELAARHCPAPMIAVTGTKGKSTTVKLITELLEACGANAVRAGNTGTPLIAELPNLSPQSWAVVEVSSFQLERAPTFKPRIGVLLNLLPDHQDYHPSLDQYWETKLRLFSHQNASDTAIVNLDDAQSVAALESGKLAGEGELALVSGRDLPVVIDQISDGAGVHEGHLGFVHEGEFEPILSIEEIPLRGEHNRANVASALASIVAALGAAQVLAHRENVAKCVREFQSLPHRLEIVAQKDGLTWVNDSQATIPDAAIAALQAFAKPVTLIAGGKNKLDDPRAYDELGRAVANHAHTLITIGETADLIAGAAREAGFDAAKIVVAGQLSAAIAAAKSHTPDGGTVVMSPACASFDQFKSFEDRGEQFRAGVLALS